MRHQLAIKKLYFLFFLVLLATGAQAQQDTIRYQKKNERFYIGNRKLQPNELGLMLMKYTSSANELKKYQNNAKPGTYILLVALTSGIIALTQLKKDAPLLTPYSITLFAGDLIALPLMLSAKKHLRKSAALYNMELTK